MGLMGGNFNEKEIASRRLCTNYGIPRTFHQTETIRESKGEKGGLTKREALLSVMKLSRCFSQLEWFFRAGFLCLSLTRCNTFF